MGNRLPAARLLSPLALLAANVISQVSFVIAISWFVRTTIESTSQTGITFAAEAFPVTVSGVLGSAAIDRRGYKRASIVSDLQSGLKTFMILLL